MIQLITKNNFKQTRHVTISSFDSPHNFGDYKLTIIDLNNDNLWTSRISSHYTSSEVNSPIHSLKDFRLLSEQINQTDNMILFLLPGDLEISYGSDSYPKWEKIKNRLDLFSKWMKQLDNTINYESDIVFSVTNTLLGNTEFPSSFVFKKDVKKNTTTKNISQSNPTTINAENIYITTLLVYSDMDLFNLLTGLNFISIEERISPEWMEGVNMFDDIKQKQIIESNKNAIDEAQLNIYSAEKSIESNNYLKSILHTQSDSLVETVFEIIEEIFDCDLSNFEDEKLKDFNFEVDGRYYIGEIKGVTSNVKNENISQLDVHYQRFIDENPEIDPENIYALLIMNHQRKKPLSARESVHDNQIQLAKRNGSLIVETYELLKMLDKLRRKELTNEQCIEMLSSKTDGILRINK